jgi:hypothetical protein
VHECASVCPQDDRENKKERKTPLNLHKPSSSSHSMDQFFFVPCHRLALEQKAGVGKNKIVHGVSFTFTCDALNIREHNSDSYLHRFVFWD